MALRLLEIMVPAKHRAMVEETIGEAPKVGPWFESLDGDLALVRLVMIAEQTGELIDRLEDRLSHVEKFQVLIVPIAATVPRLDEGPPPNDAASVTTALSPEEEADAANEARVQKATGLSREELHQQILDMAKLSRVYVAMVLLSGVVAAIGMLRSNVAVIIGAMVIAPLLGPNVALAFAATIGDTTLLRRAFLVNGVGVTLSLALSALVGVIATFDPLVPEIASRTDVGWADILLALASGTAGALAITTGVPAALVGVMVAVAILPPTVAVGLMAGAGEWSLAYAAAMLLATNVICVNLAGITTFLVQGIRPRVWWRKRQASIWARWALSFWMSALTILIALILLRNCWRVAAE